MMIMIDFTNCPINLSANYGGSDQKRGIYYQGELYMLKMPDKIPNSKRNDLNDSYSNSVFSENVCCEILRSLGFSAQETLLGYATDKEGSQKVVVACKDFIPNGYVLLDFKTIANALLMGRKIGKIPKIKDIYDIFKGGNDYFSKEFGEVALKQYWDIFILDAMLGNYDRCTDDWAYLVKSDKFDIKLAPIYDCGDSLYPQVTDDAISDILSSEKEIMLRIEKFPTAALEDQNGRKVNYMNYINSLQNPDCTAALLRVVPRLDLERIKKVIYENDMISSIRKDFYFTMIKMRIKHILMPAYEKAVAASSLSSISAF